MYHPNDDGFDGTCLAPGCDRPVPVKEPRKIQRRQGGTLVTYTDGRSLRDQRRTCSAKCRVALSRSRREKARKAEYRDCALCGQPFLVRGRGVHRRTVCPYDDADDYCVQLQDEAEDAQSMRAAALEEAVCAGPDCGEPIPYSGRGRPPKFCSPRCRTRSYRSNQKGA